MTTATTSKREETCARFLAAAEAQFAEHGYDGTKIRAIAAGSGANLGVLSHYWGSKKALFRDLFERRLKPIADRQLAETGALMARHKAGEAVSVADVVRSHIEPAFMVGGRDAADAASVRRMMGRAMTDPSGEVVEIMSEFFEAPAQLFFDLLRDLCPHLDVNEFYWRCNCTIGAFAFGESHSDRLAIFFDDAPRETDWQQAVDVVVAFLSAGLASPPVTTGK